LSTFADYRKEVEEDQREIFERGAPERENDLQRHRYYYRAMRDLLTGIVEENKRVLCLRSDTGQYLEWVQPAEGVGVEVVEALTELARSKYGESHPHLRFQTGDLEALPVEGTFDYILIVDAINEVFDVQATLAGLRAHCTPNTKLVIVFYNFLWQPMAARDRLLQLPLAAHGPAGGGLLPQARPAQAELAQLPAPLTPGRAGRLRADSAPPPAALALQRARALVSGE